MRRYVLTGTPGSGKTALLRWLELAGQPVVEEAATDVIALQQAVGVDEPWRDPAFLDRIVDLQIRRQTAAAHDVAFYDRSPICTLALARHLGRSASPGLLAEIDRIVAGQVYEPAVFFVRNQGFVRPTEARRISFEESLAFERIHEDTYRELGFTLVDVPPGPLGTRAAVVRAAVGAYWRP